MLLEHGEPSAHVVFRGATCRPKQLLDVAATHAVTAQEPVIRDVVDGFPQPAARAQDRNAARLKPCLQGADSSR